MARKSTICIPVSPDGSVPHWAESQDRCTNNLKEFQDLLTIGFPTDNRSGWSEESWKHWIDWRIREYNFDWREPWEFSCTFKIEGYSRGRSAAYFNLKAIDSTVTCSMFMTDMAFLIDNSIIDRGVVSGRWMFCKRGSNYGIKFLGA